MPHARKTKTLGRKKVPGWVKLVGTLADLTNFALFYLKVIRPWILRWGTTSEERLMTLTGDAIIEKPRFVANHAVTINAPVETVWQWLAQIGQGRGGLYSYQWLENLAGCEIYNADHILPEFQNIATGDIIKLHPQLSLKVLQAEPNSVLLLAADGSKEKNFEKGLPQVTWAFVLESRDSLTTRLLVRFRTDYKLSFKDWLVNQAMLEPIHFIMERKMLKTLKYRAEIGYTMQAIKAPLGVPVSTFFHL